MFLFPKKIYKAVCLCVFLNCCSHVIIVVHVICFAHSLTTFLFIQTLFKSRLIILIDSKHMFYILLTKNRVYSYKDKYQFKGLSKSVSLTLSNTLITGVRSRWERVFSSEDWARKCARRIWRISSMDSARSETSLSKVMLEMEKNGNFYVHIIPPSS